MPSAAERCPSVWIGGYDVALACALPVGHWELHNSHTGVMWDDSIAPAEVSDAD